MTIRSTISLLRPFLRLNLSVANYIASFARSFAVSRSYRFSVYSSSRIEGNAEKNRKRPFLSNVPLHRHPIPRYLPESLSPSIVEKPVYRETRSYAIDTGVYVIVAHLARRSLDRLIGGEFSNRLGQVIPRSARVIASQRTVKPLQRARKGNGCYSVV